LFGCHFAVYDGVDTGFPARYALAGFFIGDIHIEDDDEGFRVDEGAVNGHGMDLVSILPPFAFGEDCGFAFGFAGHWAIGHGFEAGGVVGVEGGDCFVEFAFFAEGKELGCDFVGGHVGRVSKLDDCGMKRRPLGDSFVGFVETEAEH